MVNRKKLYTFDDQFIKELDRVPKKFSGIVIDNNCKEYWLNGLKHKIDKPAIVFHDDKSEFWYVYGKLHRIGGPAITLSSFHKSEQYYIDGKRVTKEYHDLLFNMIKLKGMTNGIL